MIQQGINIRDEFKEKVKNFCSLNNVKCSYNVYKNISGSGVLVGEVDNVVKVTEYINLLEKERVMERSKKSFWWNLITRIWIG